MLSSPDQANILKSQIEILEKDLSSEELKINPHHDLPFAIFRYDPEQEFMLRKEVKLLSIRLESKGKNVHVISLADLFFESVEKEGGKEQIIKVEKELGFNSAQETLNTYFTEKDFSPIPDLLENRIKTMNKEKDIVFLIRAGIFSPDSYKISVLLDEMHGRTLVPIVLFYPGKIDSNLGLRFMGLPGRHSAGSYHVKIYNR